MELIPANDEERLAAVHRYDVLDTPPDGAFDRITALAARLFDVPISIVSLVDRDRIWFKSHHGIDATEIGRDPGLCASAVCQLEPWLVTDAKVDLRTIDNPLVAGELGLRFYLGVPLITSDGFNLGTLNVIDVEPREVTDAEVETLQDLAAIVVDELEVRLAARRKLEERRQRALELNDDVVQGLALAKLALESGRLEQAREAVSDTLRTAQSMVGELLERAGKEGRLRPGDLVRRSGASASQPALERR
ncbi:MAG: GAF domain-containing protein [Gaiellaceae bacterium MAG52_C11]|nr:GAF domain-containing protein [Candidatus Gaiellasilicea maunaloa]